MTTFRKVTKDNFWKAFQTRLVPLLSKARPPSHPTCPQPPALRCAELTLVSPRVYTWLTVQCTSGPRWPMPQGGTSGADTRMVLFFYAPDRQPNRLPNRQRSNPESAPPRPAGGRRPAPLRHNDSTTATCAALRHSAGGSRVRGSAPHCDARRCPWPAAAERQTVHRTRKRQALCGGHHGTPDIVGSPSVRQRPAALQH